VRCVLLVLAACTIAFGSERQARYYAHETVEDQHGVIAPWYQGQNGQCDLRVRIAAETLKRYPWCDWGEAITPAPHYVYSGAWGIAPDGTITIPPIGDWANGDLGQRAAYLLSALVDYYRYSGDPAAISHLSVTANTILDHCQTGRDHAWPEFLISVPTKGKPYGKADPHGFIQLDITAEVGLGLVRAYQLVGEKRWLRAATHWAEVLAEKRDRRPGHPPWGRYANAEDVTWADRQTGGVAFLLCFFDELIRMGCRGEGDCIVAARDAGRDYLRDTLLPRWTIDDTWGRNYWDWEDFVQAENVTEFVVRYMMEQPDAFPNWRADCRNIMSLFINRTSVSPGSNGDVYSGAWAYPESSGCCGRSLWYGPMELATVYAEYGVRADSEWAREMARRQIILTTYDVHETGVVEDNIDGGAIVAAHWFKIAHPMALKHVLGVMAWMPETFGAARENHIMRSSSVVSDVTYGDGQVAYSTFDAQSPCADVLRLAFEPNAVNADGRPLRRLAELDANGYTARRLDCGDWIVTVRHDGLRRVTVEGDDPQQQVDDAELGYDGPWRLAPRGGDLERTVHAAEARGASVSHTFVGNQVRIIGRVGPMGGKADVYVDGEKQLAGIDCWCPQTRYQQVLFTRNGLSQREHDVRVEVLGAGNPLSAGNDVYIDAVQWSDATGDNGFGEGGGPTGAQRVIFGYPGREDYVDSEGHPWRPATEFIARSEHMADVVELAWWTKRRGHAIAGTPDPELYRYGVHAPEFTAYFTVGPGTYHVRVKLAETRRVPQAERVFSIAINGEETVSGLDVTATAEGFARAADLVFNDIRPTHGVIAISFRGEGNAEAMVQAIEVGPGRAPEGAAPVCLERLAGTDSNLLANPGFEAGLVGKLGRLGETTGSKGWECIFASPSECYIFPESAYSIHPDWGLPEIRSGKEALRTHTLDAGHTIVYQEANVEPGTPYRASAFAHPVDLDGKGFGAQAGDSASLCIQELDAAGKVLVDHVRAELTEAVRRGACDL